MGISPNLGPSSSQVSMPQTSPLRTTSNSPLHSTPQSPLLSPSPSMSAPSPLTQNSPMASPMTPSPGPVPSSMTQTSPRSTLSQGLHHLDSRAFSPNNDGSMRPIQSGAGQNRIPGGQIRMGQHQILQNVGLGMNMNPANNPNLMINRGMNMNMNMNMHQQQRSLAFLDNQGNIQRMRSMGPTDQLK